MSNYNTVNILDLIEVIGEDTLADILSEFSCPKNAEIESFVRNRAIDFAKKKISVTYFVTNDDGEIISFFTLAHKALEIGCQTLSSTSTKRLSRFAQLNEENNSFTASAFLIAQFGKNYAVEEQEDWNGVRLMEKAFETLENIQRMVGGGVVYLECEDNARLLEFYQNKYNQFRPFNRRYSESDKTRYIQLLRFF